MFDNNLLLNANEQVVVYRYSSGSVISLAAVNKTHCLSSYVSLLDTISYGIL